MYSESFFIRYAGWSATQKPQEDKKKDLGRILPVQVLDILPATILHCKLIQFKKGILWSFTLKAFSNHDMYRLLQYNWVELISIE